MGLIIPDIGETALLEEILGTGYTLRLFSNDVLSGLDSAGIEALTISDFTEATFPGYAAAALGSGSWTVTAGDPATGRYPTQTFTRSTTGSSQDIYGYHVTRDSDGELVWFEVFQGGSPVAVAAGGDAIDVTPILTMADNGGVAVTIGEIKTWPTGSTPANHLVCDGSAVSRTTYAALFDLIGTTFGIGDGSTTFNLPDMSWRDPDASRESNTKISATGSSDFSGSVSPAFSTDGPSIVLPVGEWLVRCVGYWDYTITSAGTFTGRLHNTTDATNLDSSALNSGSVLTGRFDMTMGGTIEVTSGTKTIQPQFSEDSSVVGTSTVASIYLEASSVTQADDYMALSYVIRAL